jgi:hypothetical protein
VSLSASLFGVPLQTWCWPLPVLCPHVCFVHSVVVLVFCLISGGRLFTHVPEGTRLTFKACVVLLVIFLHWHVHSLLVHLHKFVFHILDFHLYLCRGTYSTYNVGDIGRFVSTNTRLWDLNQLKIGIGHTRWTEPVNDMMFFRWESEVDHWDILGHDGRDGPQNQYFFPTKVGIKGFQFGQKMWGKAISDEILGKNMWYGSKPITKKGGINIH